MITLTNNILATVASKDASALRHRPGCVSVVGHSMFGTRNHDSQQRFTFGTWYITLGVMSHTGNFSGHVDLISYGFNPQCGM